MDEVVINLEKMNKVRRFDDVSGNSSLTRFLKTNLIGVMVADAGCILEILDSYANERGFIMPLDLGAKGRFDLGSC